MTEYFRSAHFDVVERKWKEEFPVNLVKFTRHIVQVEIDTFVCTRSISTCFTVSHIFLSLQSIAINYHI